MMIMVSKNIFILTEHIESLNFDNNSVTMISGKNYNVSPVIISTLKSIFKNEGSIETTVAY